MPLTIEQKRAINESMHNVLRGAGGLITRQDCDWGEVASGAATIEPIVLYVSVVDGNDNNNGTQSRPLKTIQEAVDRIPSIIGTDVPVTIKLSPGTYLESVQVKPLLINSDVIIQGDPMIPVTLGTGISSGTIDASWVTQNFNTRLVVTGAGWTADSLIGGYFIEILSGVNIGRILPICRNDSSSLDVGLNAASSTTPNFDLRGASFRIVRPSVIWGGDDTTNGVLRINNIRGRSDVTVTGPNLASFIVENIEFSRPASTSSGIQLIVSVDSVIKTSKCSFIDSSGGGGTLTTVQHSSVRFEDSVFFRTQLRTNTNFCISTRSSIISLRSVYYGGNVGFNLMQSILSINAGHFYGQDGAILSTVGTSANLNGPNFDFCGTALSARGSTISLFNSQIKNSVNAGIINGAATIGSSALTATQLGPSDFQLSNVTIDLCPRGVILGQNTGTSLNGTTNINNASVAAVDMAPTQRSGGNMLNIATTVSMSGNVLDFVLSSSLNATIANLRAAPNKVIADTTTFNRASEV